jgi:hypothetical protein
MLNTGGEDGAECSSDTRVLENHEGRVWTRTGQLPSKKAARQAGLPGDEYVGGTLLRLSFGCSPGSLGLSRCYSGAAPFRAWTTVWTNRPFRPVGDRQTSSPPGSSFVGRPGGHAIRRSTSPRVSPPFGEVRVPWRLGSRGLDTEPSCGLHSANGLGWELGASSSASIVLSG